MIQELELPVEAPTAEVAEREALPVCLSPWRENPHRLASLLQMLKVHALTFSTLLDELGHLERLCASGKAFADTETFGHILGAARTDCNALGLISACKQIERIDAIFLHARAEAVSQGLSVTRLRSADLTQPIAELRRRVDEDLEECVFLQIEHENVDRCFTRSRNASVTEFVIKTPAEFFCVEVVFRFPSTAFDIGESCRCFFSECNTACVFHLMRVLELGLTSLGNVFGVSLAHTNWAPAIDQIESKIRDMPNDPAWKAKPDWKDQQEFYSQAASHFRVLKDAWRNYTAHARGKYDEREALDILIGVRGFMQKLATRLHE